MARHNSFHCTHRHSSLSGRRTEDSLLCSDLVLLRWRAENGAREEIGILEDMSRSGACVFSGVPTPERASITLRAGERSFQGEIVRCVSADNGYLVRIEPDGSEPWEAPFAAGYTPEHLLDISRLQFK